MGKKKKHKPFEVTLRGGPKDGQVIPNQLGCCVQFRTDIRGWEWIYKVVHTYKFKSMVEQKDKFVGEAVYHGESRPIRVRRVPRLKDLLG
jgi:hypothetical protein